MKKIVLIAVALLIGIGAFAQKIKIDKGEIKLDEKTIGFLEGKKPVFKIYSLDKSFFVTAELKKAPNEDSMKLPWIEIKNEATGKTNELDFKNKSRKFSAFNYDRSIIYELMDRGYFTTDGLNVEAVENFLNGESAGIAAKRLGVQGDIDNASRLADTYQLTIDDNGVIYSVKAKNPDPNDKRIGYIKMTSPSNNGELKYEVTDLDGYLTATWFAKGGTSSNYNKFLNEELITADQKVFKAVFDNRGNPIGYKMSKDITALNIVKTLAGNGYVLQHQGIDIQNKINFSSNEEQARLNKERYETAKLKSKNIYNKKGYVINEKGEKVTGEFTIEFTDIRINPNNPILVGKELYRTDAKDRSEKYQSKTGVRFCIENNDSEECYVGLTCDGESLTSSLIKSLETDNSFFYKVLYEDNGYMVLAYPSEREYLIIKVPNQERGLYTNKSSSSKLKKNITEYLKCDSFLFENHDFKTLEGLIKVLEDYKNKCKK